MSALAELKRLVAYANQVPELREMFKHITSRRPPVGDTNEWNRVTMANELLRNAEEPGVRTHVFNDPQGRAMGAYQLKADKGATDIPYFLSDVPGLGTEMLEDAYFLSPTRPTKLTAIPGSEGFYRKQKGWVENQDDGISRFQKKKKGGLIQMKECNCGQSNGKK